MVTCSYYHTEAYWFYETHASDIPRGDMKMKKRSGEKKQGKKKFRNANYAMHRKVETKQSTLSLPELGIVYIYSIKKKKE
jgi:hypothetical protein